MSSIRIGIAAYREVIRVTGYGGWDRVNGWASQGIDCVVFYSIVCGSCGWEVNLRCVGESWGFASKQYLHNFRNRILSMVWRKESNRIEVFLLSCLCPFHRDKCFHPGERHSCKGYLLVLYSRWDNTLRSLWLMSWGWQRWWVADWWHRCSNLLLGIWNFLEQWLLLVDLEIVCYSRCQSLGERKRSSNEGL